MNYRHAFHVGNHADVLKHLTLLLILDRLKQKDSPFAVLDTHAGRGVYDLEDDAAQRSPEWRGGIERIWDWADAPAPIARYRAAIAAANADGALRVYPGSPALAANALRGQDRLAACELHAEEAEALRAALGRRANVQVHARDGYEALGALLPPPERRGLVLIDPPYEAPDELARSADALKQALRRFGHGVFLWWRPLKDAAALDAADAEIGGPKLRADLAVSAPQLTGKLTASSLLVINPPYEIDAALAQALPALAAKLAIGPGAFGRVA